MCKGEFSGTCHLEVRVPWDDLCNDLRQPLTESTAHSTGRGLRERLLLTDCAGTLRIETINRYRDYYPSYAGVGVGQQAIPVIA